MLINVALFIEKCALHWPADLYLHLQHSDNPLYQHWSEQTRKKKEGVKSRRQEVWQRWRDSSEEQERWVHIRADQKFDKVPIMVVYIEHWGEFRIELVINKQNTKYSKDWSK